MIRSPVFFVTIFFILLSQVVFPQDKQAILDKTVKSLSEYTRLSLLGPGYTKEFSTEYCDQFRKLFEYDIYIFWDLDKSDTVKRVPPLKVSNYIKRARDIYKFHPKLRYSHIKISPTIGDNTSTVLLTKFNDIEDSTGHTVRVIKRKLRINYHIHENTALISGIEEDRRNSALRSIYLAFSYSPWNNFSLSLIKNPIFSPKDFTYYTCSGSKIADLSAGLGVEIRFDRNKRNWLLLELGLQFNYLEYKISINNFEKGVRRIFDSAAINRFECTVYDRSPLISEIIKVYHLSLPVSVKYYAKSWLYGRAGIQFNYISGTFTSDFILSHTGGGKVENLNTHDWFYLQPKDELTYSEFGFFRNRPMHYSHSLDLNTFSISAFLGIGFEKTFRNLILDFEPFFEISPSYVKNNDKDNNYILYPESGYRSILYCIETPKYTLHPGIKLIIGFLL
ncbi:MAG: hypothetical protein NTX61_07190 [Bacteroidetes bacterium]|nr:hypothetical protein [Bacteroidota bacterium]